MHSETIAMSQKLAQVREASISPDMLQGFGEARIVVKNAPEVSSYLADHAELGRL
jgi:hypothetical protein